MERNGNRNAVACPDGVCRRSGLRDRRCGLLELGPLLRAGAYMAAVVLLVVFGPGATKAFIYFQF